MRGPWQNVATTPVHDRFHLFGRIFQWHLVHGVAQKSYHETYQCCDIYMVILLHKSSVVAIPTFLCCDVAMNYNIIIDYQMIWQQFRGLLYYETMFQIIGFVILFVGCPVFRHSDRRPHITGFYLAPKARDRRYWNAPVCPSVMFSFCTVTLKGIAVTLQVCVSCHGGVLYRFW